MFDSEFHGHELMKLQLSYVGLCTQIVSSTFNSIEHN